jgi:hypothetical protein
MAMKQSYKDEADPGHTKSNGEAFNASEELLLEEYRVALRSLDLVRIPNRAIVLALLMLQIVMSHLALGREVVLVCIITSISCLWLLREFLTGRRLSTLGQLIAATYSAQRGSDRNQKARPIVLPPRNSNSADSAASTSGGTAPSPFSDAKSSADFASGPSWTDSYIQWRHESWKERRLLGLLKLEPVIWSLSSFACLICRIYLHVW